MRCSSRGSTNTTQGKLCGPCGSRPGAASKGEILVSDTVQALANGSGRRFEDPGVHELKGVPDPWRLHAFEGDGSEHSGR